MQVQLPTTTLSAGDKDQLSIQGIQHDSITLLLQPRTEATTKFISYIQTKPQLPVCTDIFHHPAPCWKSTDTESSVEELWRELWQLWRESREVNPASLTTQQLSSLVSTSQTWVVRHTHSLVFVTSEDNCQSEDVSQYSACYTGVQPLYRGTDSPLTDTHTAFVLSL